MTYLHDWVKDPESGRNVWHCARCFAEIAAITPPALGCVATVEEGAREALEREKAHYMERLKDAGADYYTKLENLQTRRERELTDLYLENQYALTKVFRGLIESIRADKASPELLRDLAGQPFSDRLLQAVQAGMLDLNPVQKTATVLAPPNAGAMSDDDWLAVLGAAGEVRRELEALGYEVVG